MDFFDPVGDPVVTAKEMVRNLTRRWVDEGDLRVETCALISVIPRELRALVKMLRGELLETWKGFREVYRGCVGEGSVTLALSPFGAPNAVALAEELAAFGMQRALFLGYCGSLQQSVRAGDIVVPTEAIREEGTSFHYLPRDAPSVPDREMQGAIVDVLQRNKIPYHRGKTWTTDAIYRETRGKVRKYQREGALVVDMELSALFVFGMARGVKVGGILVVCDELSEESWDPFLFSPRLIRGVRRVRKIAVEALQGMVQGIPFE